MSDSVELPERAQIIVLGGGAVGCSIAYHLARNGVRDVLLLEQGRLTCGTTWHAAGIVGQVRSTAAMTELARYSIELYSTLEEITGYSTGWRQCGALWLAQSSDRMTHLRRAVSQAGAFGTKAEIISPREAQERVPLLRIDDLVGAAWLPEDGTVNPTDVTQAMARGASQLGAIIREGVQVSGIHTERNRVTGVETQYGRIDCETLVLAAGQWSKALADTVGVTVPLFPAQHFYAVTAPIDGVERGAPIIRDPDSHVYFKEEVGGLLVGSFEPNAKPWVPSAEIPQPFEFQLLNEDWDHFHAHDGVGD